MQRSNDVTPKSRWRWFGNAGHFICARECRFHLCTQVGKFLVSTVGEYLPRESTREIIANSRGVILEGIGDAREADYMKKIGYEKLGAGDGTYETYVFKAGAPCKEKDCNCGMPALADACEIAGVRTTTAGAATTAHMKFCNEYAKRKKRSKK